MKVKHRVTLTGEERDELQAMLNRGRVLARRLMRARVLLHADEGEAGPGWTDAAIAEAVQCGVRTVERVRQRFVEEGLEATLDPRPSSRVYERKLDGEAEAHLIALTCGEPPAGHERWSLRLLAERVVALGIAESVSHETVRRTLKKTSSSPG